MAAKQNPNAAIKHGFELIRRLKQTGTGEGKLDIGRDMLTRRPTCTAEEMYDYLVKSGRVHEVTLEKARTLIDTGRLPDTVRPDAPIAIEDELAMFANQAERQKTIAATHAADPVKTSMFPAQPKQTSEQIDAERVRQQEQETARLKVVATEAELAAERERTEQARLQAGKPGPGPEEKAGGSLTPGIGAEQSTPTPNPPAAAATQGNNQGGNKGRK